MIKLHYGFTVDSEQPITGVLNTSDAEWLYEDIINNGIDTFFEEHLKECKNEEHSECYFSDTLEGYLVGFKKDEKTGLYEIDENAEYSAIVGEIYTQIVHSKYVSRCALCSPSFPGQGDLDTPGEFLTFNLPPDVYGEREYLEIMEYKKEEEFMGTEGQDRESYSDTQDRENYIEEKE